MRGAARHFRLIVVLLIVAQLLAALALPPGRVSLAQDATEPPPTEVTVEPTLEPTPTETPTGIPTPEPTAIPTVEPTATPSETPVDVTPEPTATEVPGTTPTATPEVTASPTSVPTPTPVVKPASSPVPPAITVSKNAAHVGDRLGVGIAGFTPGIRVAIRFDGARKLTLVTNAQGAANGTFTIPAAPAGLHVVRAEGGGAAVQRSVRIRPGIAIAPTTVQAGKGVIVTLTGFAANSTVRIRLYDINGSTTVLSVWVATTSETGGAVWPFTTKKTLTVGKHQVIATDAAVNISTTWLTTTEYRPPAPPPPDPSISQLFWRGPSSRAEVALTFDMDANRGTAEDILDTLAAYGVKATFGVAGYWAQANPDLIRRMVREGHQIINHTWDHPSMTGAVASEPIVVLTPAGRQWELTSLASLIKQLTGGYEVKPYWRPPYGDYDTSVLRDVAAIGYSATIMWSCDTGGYAGASVSQILNTCAYPARAGEIILMHGGAGNLDAAALPDMIEILRSKGLRMVTIEQLLRP